jgi:glycerol kinase
LAGAAAGVWSDLTEATSLVRPLRTVEPRNTVEPRDTMEPRHASPSTSARAQWHEAVRRAQGWIPELSALDF